jgi:hypothetical protein
MYGLYALISSFAPLNSNLENTMLLDPGVGQKDISCSQTERDKMIQNGDILNGMASIRSPP